MVEGDRPRFMREMAWLNGKFFEATGRVFPLPDREYFDALKDLAIEDMVATIRWMWGHAEFYPSVPGNLRKSVTLWREAHPRPYQPPAPVMGMLEIVETPESRERSTRELLGILERLNGGCSAVPLVVGDLACSVPIPKRSEQEQRDLLHRQVRLIQGEKSG